MSLQAVIKKITLVMRGDFLRATLAAIVAVIIAVFCGDLFSTATRVQHENNFTT
jgi:hypothetical protein